MDLTKLNEERKKQKLSVSELAERANLPKATIEKVLFGIVQNPRVDTMEAIERALGLDSGWTREERAAGVVDTMKVPLTVEDDEIVTLLNELKEKKGANARAVAQNVIVSLLESMIKS